MSARLAHWALATLMLVLLPPTDASRDWRRALMQQDPPIAPPAPLGVSNATGPITEVVVMGDSFSDAGRFFLLRNSTSPSPLWYWHGRYSNGPTWPEYLQALANGQPFADVNNTFPVTLNTSVPTLSGFTLNASSVNFSTLPLRVIPLAIAGSPACEANRLRRTPGSNETGYETLSWMDLQIDDFVSVVNGTSREFNASSQSPAQRLIILEVGGNDYLNKFDNLTDAFNLNFQLSTFTEAVVGCVLAGVQRLLALGERNIMVFTLPGLDRAPQVNAVAIAPLIAFMASIINTHNNLLRQGVEVLRANHTDANLYVYELGNATARVLDNPSTYNMNDTRNSCLQYGAAVTDILGRIPGVGDRAKDTLDRLVESEVLGRCDNPDQYVYWDKVHPTTAVHSLYAQDIIAILQKYGLRP